MLLAWSLACCWLGLWRVVGLVFGVLLAWSLVCCWLGLWYAPSVGLGLAAASWSLLCFTLLELGVPAAARLSSWSLEHKKGRCAFCWPALGLAAASCCRSFVSHYLNWEYLLQHVCRRADFQKIAKLGSRFSEHQEGPLSGPGTLLTSLAGTAVGFRFLFYGRWAVGPLDRWQTSRGCPDCCAGAMESPLASPRWFFTLGLKPSLQWLWRRGTRLLASNRVRGEFGRVREASRLWRQLRTHATRVASHTDGRCPTLGELR